jgi:hypothetical protein
MANQLLGCVMSITELNRVIKQFAKTHGTDIYRYGLCSEFAVALKRFLGAGELYKHGLFHVCLKYKGYYCDIRGCQTESKLLMDDPIALSKDANRKAKPEEVQHLMNLLQDDKVQNIIKGLNEAKNKIGGEKY